MLLKRLLTAGALSVLASSTAIACEIGARVNIIGNEFEAIKAVAAGAQACTGAPVEANLTAEHQSLNVVGMLPNPAEYTTAIIANSSIVALMNDDVIRPLNDLVEKHGQDLQPTQLIKIGDDIMAVAFMANAQHLMYRKDVLAEAGVEVPTTYEEMLEAAKVIREKGLAENPIGGAYASGWNLAQEFNNMFLGYGGEFFKPGSAEPNVNSEAGVNALNMMKALTDYMNPDYLTHDSNATNAEYRAGNVVLLHMWGSRASQQTTTDGVTEEVKAGHAIAGPLTVGGGDIPASTLWWDGWTVAKNISDEEAEATFIAMMNGVRPELMDDPEAAKLAVWLIEGYEPAPDAAGVFAAAQSGTKPYPMLPYMGLLHTALGNEIADFLKGDESAEETLADVEAAYVAAAKEKGFLQ